MDIQTLLLNIAWQMRYVALLLFAVVVGGRIVKAVIKARKRSK